MSEETTGTELLEESSGVATEEIAGENGDAGQEKPQEGKLPRGVQRSIDRLTRQTREAQERVRELEERLAEKERPQKNPEEMTDEEKVEYLVNKKLSDRDAQARAIQQQEQRNQKISDGIAELAKEDPEIVELIKDAAHIKIPNAAVDFIQDSEHAARLLAHLAKNADEAQALNGKTPAQIDRYFSRVEARIELELANKKPAEAQEKGAKATPQSKPNDPAYRKSPSDMSTKEWMEWRRGEEAKKRKR